MLLNSTALHELAHSTGHVSRLNRNINNEFGSVEYAYEELIAELSSCFMSVDLHTDQLPEHVENHKAYVQSWLQMLKEDPEILFKAIKEAQATSNYMDYKAGLMSEHDYQKTLGKSMTIELKDVSITDHQTKSESEGLKSDYIFDNSTGTIIKIYWN